MAFIKINKQNFFHNLNQIALQTGAVDKIALVLKDNAYGHGLELMATLASEFGIKHAVVRNTDEAKKITSYFESILVLGDTIVKYDTFSYAVNSIVDIQKAQKGAKVELKVDTGMHRNGIAIEQLDEALDLIKEKALQLVGVMTHYRSADEMGSSFFWQTKQFENIQKRVIAAGFTRTRFHSHNSAAILRKKSFNEDLVRVGIAAYGYNELSKPFDKIILNPILSLHAKKLSTRILHKGQRVGYGGDFIASKEMKISTYDIGYGDGLCRADEGTTFITTEKLPILGRVSMDFITLQSEKEEVCIMDDAQEAAKQLKTISYALVTALHEKLERTVN
jgi:alanine racemase